MTESITIPFQMQKRSPLRAKRSFTHLALPLSVNCLVPYTHDRYANSMRVSLFQRGITTYSKSNACGESATSNK